MESVGPHEFLDCYDLHLNRFGTFNLSEKKLNGCIYRNVDREQIKNIVLIMFL